MADQAQHFVLFPGGEGERYSARELARCLGVSNSLVVRWIERGWLRASKSPARGYLIRRKAVRRILSDFPGVARVVAEAAERRARKMAAPAGRLEAGRSAVREADRGGAAADDAGEGVAPLAPKA